MDASMDDRIVEQGPLGNQERFNSDDTKRKIPLDTTWHFSAKVPKT